MTTAAELRQCDDDELDTRLVNARRELFNLRFQLATGRLDNYSRSGQVKRDIARILTIQQSRSYGLELASIPTTGTKPAKRRRGSDATEES